MDDAVNPRGIPSGAKMVAAYLDGRYANTGEMFHLFPNAYHVTIGIFLGHLADFTDVEPGNPIKTPALVRADFEHRKAHGVFRPGFYADRHDMENIVLPGLSGIPRSEYRLWLADPTGKLHLIPGYDAVQGEWLGAYDVSEVADSFFPPSEKPRKRFHGPPVRKIVRKVIHPKTLGAGAGTGSGVGLVAVLTAFKVHLTPAEGAAIASVLGFIISYLTPPTPKGAS